VWHQDDLSCTVRGRGGPRPSSWCITDLSSTWRRLCAWGCDEVVLATRFLRWTHTQTWVFFLWNFPRHASTSSHKLTPYRYKR
jgi:hypothetical protein